MIIFGVKEADETAAQSLEDVVSQTILKGKLNIADVAIERIHEIGKPKRKQVQASNYKLGRDKDKILKNCCNLKGTGFSLPKDFSARVRQIRNKQWDATKQHCDNGDEVVHSSDKIRINSKLFRWDDTLNKMVPMNPQ